MTSNPKTQRTAAKRERHNPKIGTSPKAVGTPSTVIVAHLRERMSAAGGDPASIPDLPFRMMRPAETAAMLGVCTATYYRLVADGALPKPVDIGRGRPLPAPKNSVAA